MRQKKKSFGDQGREGDGVYAIHYFLGSSIWFMCSKKVISLGSWNDCLCFLWEARASTFLHNRGRKPKIFTLRVLENVYFWCLFFKKKKMTIVSIRTIIPHRYIALIKIHPVRPSEVGKTRLGRLNAPSLQRKTESLPVWLHCVRLCGERACLCECAPECACRRWILGSCPWKDTVNVLLEVHVNQTVSKCTGNA